MNALRLTRTADRTYRLDGTAGQLRTHLEAYGAQTRKPSVGDFYLLRFTDDRHTAEGAAAALERQGIIPRPVAAGGPASATVAR